MTSVTSLTLSTSSQGSHAEVGACDGCSDGEEAEYGNEDNGISRKRETIRVARVGTGS